jgi:hypothetical protein
MTTWPSLVRIGTGLALLGTAHTALNAELLRKPKNDDGQASRCAVSILVPARDEASNIGACLLSLLAQDVRPAAEIIILDDASCDGTADIARAVAGAERRIRIMTGQPVPPHWLGKPRTPAINSPPPLAARMCWYSSTPTFGSLRMPCAWLSACWTATTSTSFRPIHARSRPASQNGSSSPCCSGRG